ncbi:MAG: rRNA maturation RNase YbeY [Candidatus Wallbacteria bacterium]|nr:rRNA maturation RNase YbeY [Candidatus Wallbacteria bacterium]
MFYCVLVKLLVDDRSGQYRIFPKRLRDAADRMAAALALPGPTTVSLVFCSVRTLAQLGKRHFGKGRTTDVIAFPTGFEGLDGMLGEIWIAPDTVARNGLRFGKGFNAELLFVFAHGLLHLLGKDDDTEARRNAMFRRQEKLLDACRSDGGALPIAIARKAGRRC